MAGIVAVASAVADTPLWLRYPAISPTECTAARQHHDRLAPHDTAGFSRVIIIGIWLGEVVMAGSGLVRYVAGKSTLGYKTPYDCLDIRHTASPIVTHIYNQPVRLPEAAAACRLIPNCPTDGAYVSRHVQCLTPKAIPHTLRCSNIWSRLLSPTMLLKLEYRI